MTTRSIKRRYPRLEAPRSAVVAWKTIEYHEVSHVKTLALGGLFIYTKNPPAMGTMLRMLIVTPRGYVRMRATVRSVSEGEGMGVEFVSMEPEDRGKLERWLKSLSGHAETPS